MNVTEDMRAPRKAKAILNRLLNNRSITPEGLSWLTVSTDPFHDSEVSCSGYPDISTSRSLVQTFTQTQVISAPGGRVDPTKTWNCLTFFNPCSPPFNSAGGAADAFYQTGINNNGVVMTSFTSGGAPSFFSGVNAVFSESTLFGPTTLAYPGLAPPINYTSGPFRLIAAGYEVVNTTADLYKQGSVTCFKSPSGYARGVVSTKNAGNDVWNVATEFSAGLPADQSEAALYPNSRTWEAKEGAYVVCTLNKEVGFVTPSNATAAGLVLDRAPDGSVIAMMPRLTPFGAAQIVPGNSTLFPYDVSGAYFTGLHPQTSLQVTARYIIERVPSIKEKDLLVLTRVPCSYDPLVLELYSRILQEMPVACMVKDNPLGEWFADMLSVLGDVAPMIGNVIPLPGAGLIGQAIGSGSKAISTTMKRANVQKSPQAPQKKKGPKQPQNPPGTGKRARNKKKT